MCSVGWRETIVLTEIHRWQAGTWRGDEKHVGSDANVMSVRTVCRGFFMLGMIRGVSGSVVVITARRMYFDFRGSTGRFPPRMIFRGTLALLTCVRSQPTATARKVLGSKRGKHQHGYQTIHESTPVGNYCRLSAIDCACQRRFGGWPPECILYTIRVLPYEHLNTFGKSIQAAS